MRESLEEIANEKQGNITRRDVLKRAVGVLTAGYVGSSALGCNDNSSYKPSFYERYEAGEKPELEHFKQVLGEEKLAKMSKKDKENLDAYWKNASPALKQITTCTYECGPEMQEQYPKDDLKIKIPNKDTHSIAGVKLTDLDVEIKKQYPWIDFNKLTEKDLVYFNLLEKHDSNQGLFSF
ncbi:MAG: hypothetical protein ABIH37_02960 [archaeon]